jgi:hypothetical protein
MDFTLILARVEVISLPEDRINTDFTFFYVPSSRHRTDISPTASLGRKISGIQTYAGIVENNRSNKIKQLALRKLPI